MKKDNKTKTISRRKFLRFASTSAAGIALAGLPFTSSIARAKTKEVKQKPNIIFFYIDDLGWKDVGFNGSKYYEMPNIDKLARQGMIFKSAYMAPTCAPSRACLTSGQYPPRHGIYTVDAFARTPEKMREIKAFDSKRFLSTDVITMAEAIKPADYVSASIGKWHVGDRDETLPTGQGFNVNVAGCEWGKPKSYFSPYQNRFLTDGPDGEYLTDRLNDEAIKFIKANKDGPFFLYFPHYAVHVPLEARKELINKYKNKKPHRGQNNPVYAAMIESIDIGIGRIMNKLKELGLVENTIIIFSSDNGGQNMCTSNLPLRGQKGNIYEGGIRVPTFIVWPGVTEPGSTCDVPITVVDFYPTLVEMAGIREFPSQILDGESLVPLLRGDKKLKREAIYWHLPCYNGNGKANAKVWQPPVGAIRKGDWKLIEFFEDGHLELYNLRQDIGETNNLAKSNPEKTKELLADLRTWQKKTNAQIPKEPNPLYDPDARSKINR